MKDNQIWKIAGIITLSAFLISMPVYAATQNLSDIVNLGDESDNPSTLSNVNGSLEVKKIESEPGNYSLEKDMPHADINTAVGVRDILGSGSANSGGQVSAMMYQQGTFSRELPLVSSEPKDQGVFVKDGGSGAKVPAQSGGGSGSDN